MGIFSRLFGQREPPAEPMDHATLGRLEFEPEGWWEGNRTVRGELDLGFCIAGDRLGPATALVAPLHETLEEWSAVESKIRSFLEPRIAGFPEASVEDFTPNCVLYLWPHKPQYFMVELSMKGDEYGIWKVEFEDGEATYLSRDD